ncbi:MAG TPA: ABC transporter permease [Candidatus Saccharimonadales bacterium]|nr:ABC transporter permease [Candidatus Saccharimonadales bacterium]
MNVVTRGIRNALRSPVRSGAIVIMLAISVGLILAMLVARSSVNAKINEVKATTATNITINPAGMMGGMGGGDPLTADQVAKIKATAHVSSVVATLTDQLSTDNTSLTPSLELGKRMMRISNDGGATTTETPASDSTNTETRTPPISVTGTATPTSTVAEDKLTSGAMIDGDSSDLVAIVGKTLAEKNNLSVGSTFTMYGKTITVKGIYSLDNKFQDSSIIMPLTTTQTLTDQAGAVSSVIATVDSSDNVTSTTTALKSALGDKADVTSEEEQAKSSLEPLESIASLALGGVVAATIAGAIIILLAMIMIVRERRREIGVIKAIGGTNKKVITQFVSEALTLTVIGSLVGLGLGILVSGPMTQSLVSNQSSSSSSSMGGAPSRSGAGPRMLSFEGAGSQLKTNLTSVTSTLTPQTFAISSGIILLIAVIGSAIPAWAIARVRPAEVLRTE